MSNISDYKRDSMQTVLGSSVTNIDDLEKLYLAAAGATALDVNKAWYEVFVLNGASSLSWNNAAQEFLVALGATGTNLADNWSWFWITNGGVIGSAYDPGMMTFDGSTGYYNATPTIANNTATVINRLNVASFSGGGIQWLANIGGGGFTRLSFYLVSNDYATVEQRDRLIVYGTNSTGTTICRLMSDTVVCDGSDHLAFCSWDSGAGTSVFYIDGSDADDVTLSNRLQSTGTMATTSGAFQVGALGDADFLNGKAGYVGASNTYLTNPLDFMDGSTPKELDEVTWTEWGAQPLFWNDEGTMTVNKGSAGNMTANGTITGPA